VIQYFQTKNIHPNPANPMIRQQMLQKANADVQDHYYQQKKHELI